MSDGLRISGLMRKPEGNGPFPVVLETLVSTVNRFRCSAPTTSMKARPCSLNRSSADQTP